MSLLVTYAAATGLVTAGVGTVASIIGGGCSGAVATMYVGAYNDCEEIWADYGSSQKVRMRTTYLLGLISKVGVSKV